MTRTTEIIVNRNARRLHEGSLLGQILARVQGRARIRQTRTLPELAQAASEIARTAPDCVVLCGGDGSFMAGVSALYRAYGAEPLPELALVPAGTVATVARNWGAKRPLRTLEHALTGNTATLRERSTLALDDGHAVRIGFTFGSGLVAQFFRAYDAAPRRGLLAAAGIAGRVFAGSFVGAAQARQVLAPMACELCVEGRPLEYPAYSLLVCSVVRDLGLHLLVTYRADADPERVQLVAAALPPHRLGAQALRVLAGKPMSGPGVFDALVRDFSLRFPERAPYVLDGDTFWTEAVRVQPGPRIRVVS